MLVLVLATVMDALIFNRLAAVFDVSAYALSPAGLLVRAVTNAGIGILRLRDHRPPAASAGEAGPVRIYEDLRGLQRRVGVAQAVVALPLALLVVYFWHLQVVRGRYFRELSENNRIRAIPIPAPRGPLFDRNGRILAENRSSFNVVLTTERRDDLRRALARIATLITFDPAEVEERLNQRGPRFRSLVVKSDATEEDVARWRRAASSSRKPAWRWCRCAPTRWGSAPPTSSATWAR